MRLVFLLLGLVLAATTPAYPEADTRPLFKLPQDIEFTGPSDQLPLLHMWTLAVEEQFYIVWPLAMLAAASAAVAWLLLIFARAKP